MSKRLLDYDQLTGTSVFHHFDQLTNETHIETVQDVQPWLDKAHRLSSDTSYKRNGIKSDWYHFATVPNMIIMELKSKHNLDINNKYDLPKIEKILKQEYKKFLTVDRI